MKPYLLIDVGVEGINKIVAYSYRAKKIIKIRDKAIKKEIIEYMKREKWICKQFGWDRMGKTVKRISDKFCVQQWNGKKFDCECKKLGIKIEEKILYF